MGRGNYDALVGRRVGRWTVVRIEDRVREANGRLRPARAFCVCDCGSSKVVLVNNLLRETTQSCGCLASEVTSARNVRSRGRRPKNYTHGMSKNFMFTTWAGIKTRCYNPGATGYCHYGAVGIRMHPDWEKDFVSFHTYVINNLGERPDESYTLDRIDVYAGYVPGNIRWASPVQQANNARSNIRLTYLGETLTLAQWCQRLNLNYRTIRDRIMKLSWSTERALGTPAKGYVGTNARLDNRECETV